MNHIQNDDLALVIRPNVENGKWQGTVDLNAIVMPNEHLSDEDKEELIYMMQALVICFSKLNSDEEFSQQIQEELVRSANSGAFRFTVLDQDGMPDNVVSLSEWTHTKGNA
jgi:hypothetical protein